MKNDQYIQTLSELIGATRNFIEDQKRAGHHSIPVAISVSSRANQTANTSSSKASLPSLAQVQAQADNCRQCSLHQHRNHVVFGAGRQNVDLMVVTPSPSPEEDIKGQPLLGEAGQLFSNMLSAIGLGRGQVYITPVVKCRAGQGESVEPKHVEACHGYLAKQVQIIQPAMILALGQAAGQSVTNQQGSLLAQLRGEVYQFEQIDTIVTFEPTYLVRHPENKKEAWEDMKNLHAMICKKTGKKLPRKG